MLAVCSLLFLPATAQAQSESPAASGLYVGGFAGFVAARFHYVEPDDPPAGISPHANGFVGGALAGYEQGMNRLRLGVEGDVGAGTAKVSAGFNARTDYIAIDPAWTARVRGRIGYARWHIVPYAAVGLAVARVKTDDALMPSSKFQVRWAALVVV